MVYNDVLHHYDRIYVILDTLTFLMFKNIEKYPYTEKHEALDLYRKQLLQ